jgi:hypothetical protein
MPIEFRCGQCGKLLRTGDDTVGRQAQCPECGSLTGVPGPAERTGATPPLAPLGAGSSASSDATSGNPSGAGQEWRGTQGSQNPYQSPVAYANLVAPAQRVSAPATALIVTGILGICLQVLGIIFNLIQMTVGVQIAHQGPEAIPVMFGTGINLVFGAIFMAIGVVVVVGATKMKNLENYSLAMASAIIAVIPCISPCCLLGLPFGIWALVVLNDSSVKAAFRS